MVDLTVSLVPAVVASIAAILGITILIVVMILCARQKRKASPKPVATKTNVCYGAHMSPGQLPDITEDHLYESIRSVQYRIANPPDEILDYYVNEGLGPTDSSCDYYI